MTATDIEAEFKHKICSQVRLAKQGKDRFRVFTPFRFDDGDLLSVVLKRDGSGWGLTDEGNTFMRLSYDLDEKVIMTGQRGAIIEGAIEGNGIENRGGVLWSVVEGDGFGDALYSLIRAVLRIVDVQAWTRSAVKDTFLADLRQLVVETVPATTPVTFDWRDKDADPKGQYPVDCRIEAKDRPPLFLFGINSDLKCNVSTIVVLHFQKIDHPFRSLAVFEDQEEIGSKPLARLSDAVDKQFSNLIGNRKQIADYINEYAHGTSA